MKPIENLDVLILSAERMSDTFRAFQEIPEVLKALQAAQNYPAELDRAILQKKKESDALDKALALKDRELAAIESNRLNKSTELASLDEKLKKKIIENEQRENFELEKLRKANNDAAEASLRTLNHELRNHKDIIAESENDMQRLLEEHQAKVDAKMQELEEVEQKLEKAKAELAKIRKSLEV